MSYIEVNMKFFIVYIAKVVSPLISFLNVVQ